MALDQIILVSNPGSTSRKYALYKGDECLLQLHFEVVGRKVVYTSSLSNKEKPARISHVSFVATKLPEIIQQLIPDFSLERVNAVGLRIVAPSSFFQRDHIINKNVIKRLERLKEVAPLHIQATLSEYTLLKSLLPKVRFIGISDSAFLSHKPEAAMLYGIPYDDAAKLDIKRFGYHGLSLESVVDQLKKHKKLPVRMVVCHMGGGVSIASVRNGRVLDSSMGFSPLEGVVMATRSGSMDMIAFERLRTKHKLTDDTLYEYFNTRSGLLGVSGLSSDIRDLLVLEPKNESARRALDLYVYKIQQAIGAMSASMGGLDVIVFTGTVGERSSEMRRRIMSNFLYLGFQLDSSRNKTGLGSSLVTEISKTNSPAKIYIIHTNEDLQIARHVAGAI